MVWHWNLAHIEAILCQVKINCEFSKWRIIFHDVSTTLRQTVTFTIFWYILLTGVVQSSPNTYFQKRWFLLANTTWKWQKVKNYWKKRLHSVVDKCHKKLGTYMYITFTLQVECFCFGYLTSNTLRKRKISLILFKQFFNWKILFLINPLGASITLIQKPVNWFT